MMLSHLNAMIPWTRTQTPTMRAMPSMVKVGMVRIGAGMIGMKRVVMKVGMVRIGVVKIGAVKIQVVTVVEFVPKVVGVRRVMTR